MLHNIARYTCRYADKNPTIFWTYTILGAVIGAFFFGVGIVPGIFVGVIVGGYLSSKFPSK